MKIVKLKDDRIEFVANKEEFIELVKQEMGEDSAEYIKDNIDLEEDVDCLESTIDDLELINDSLQDENEHLKDRIVELEQEQNIPLDRIVEHKIFKVIQQVNKLTNISKSQKIADQKQIIVEMLKEIIDNENIK